LDLRHRFLFRPTQSSSLSHWSRLFDSAGFTAGLLGCSSLALGSLCRQEAQLSFVVANSSLSERVRKSGVRCCRVRMGREKRAANLEKHGYDFADADLVYDNPAKFTIPSARSGESRLQDVAMMKVNGLILTLVYVVRGYNIRIISFRKASRRERRAYDNFRLHKQDRFGPS